MYAPRTVYHVAIASVAFRNFRGSKILLFRLVKQFIKYTYSKKTHLFNTDDENTLIGSRRRPLETSPPSNFLARRLRSKYNIT